uniref:Secreted protein n=1 Tax=Dromaius novaehollandiae TaxID=8790 RepID=A0A8C4P7F4_DRONO
MVVVTRAGCRAALFLWIFSSISCRARTALPASRKYLFQRTMHIVSSTINQKGLPTTLGGCLFFL